jgi:hypothetical protein
MADLTLDTVSDTARDAFYVTVGAGVIAFQKLQVQRVEPPRRSAPSSRRQGHRQRDARLGVRARRRPREAPGGAPLHPRGRLETLLSQLEGKLPEQAKDLVKQARDLVARAA